MPFDDPLGRMGTGSQSSLVPTGESAALLPLVNMVRFGTYFEILGMNHDSSLGEARRKAQELLSALTRFDEEPERLGLSRADLDQIRWVVHEAGRVLSDRTLKKLYTLGQATGGPGVGRQ